MSNSLGTLFRITSFGENRGDAIGCIIDGCPSGLILNAELVQAFLDKRKPREKKFASLCPEGDKIAILSGVFEGKTTGTPITLAITNKETAFEDKRLEHIFKPDVFQPGQADFTYYHKYGNRDYRAGGRAAARDLITRTAAGAVAQLYLEQVAGIKIFAYLSQIGPMVLDFVDEKFVYENTYCCPNEHQVEDIKKYLDDLYEQNDSIGAKISVVVKNAPVGLGSPVFGRLDASLGFALMSISSIKGFEMGPGFKCVTQRGSENRDQMDESGFMTNNSGGVLGGISTGQDLYMSVCSKPTSIIPLLAKTQKTTGEVIAVENTGSYEPCIGMRAIPSVEAMTAITILDHYLQYLALNSARVTNKDDNEQERCDRMDMPGSSKKEYSLGRRR